MADPAKLVVKVVPKASRDELAGWIGDALKVRVSAAPERGKANAAVVAIIAATLGVPAPRVRLVAGTASERKTIAVDGLSDGELRARVQAALEYNRGKR